MSKDYSLDALNRFFDYTIDKGILKPETAKSRKVASNKIFEKLTPEQLADLRLVDLDTEADRFANRQGSGYLPASLQVYKSRARSALSEFFAYVENPMTFKPSVAARATTKNNGGSTAKRSASTSAKAVTQGSEVKPIQQPASQEPITHNSLIFPIPIRPGLVIKLMNIPDDLSPQEAEKIAQVVKALAYKE